MSGGGVGLRPAPDCWGSVEGPLERDVASGARRLVAGAANRLAMPIPVRVAIAFGIEKLDFVGVDEVPVVFAARLLVVPGLGAPTAFEVDAVAFVEVFADHLGSAAESFHSEPTLATEIGFCGDRGGCDRKQLRG